MRLGTLARKLDINTDEVVTYLNKNGIEIEDSPNTKLDQNQLDLVNSAFYKEKAIVVEKEEAVVVEKEVVVAVKKDIQSEKKSEKKHHQSEYLQDADDFTFDVFGIAEEMEGFVASVNELTLKGNDRSQHNDVKEPSESNTESSVLSTQEEELSIEELAARDDVKTLRAKKVKLGGIKVVGKIDLPEPKKKPELIDPESNKESDSADTQKQQVEEKPKGLYGDFVKQQRKTSSRSGRTSGQHNRKQLSFEEKQKREEQRIKREKEREKRALKKKKEAHYKNNVLPKIETAAPKTKKKAKKVVKTSITESKKIQTKNPIQKLWAWLNGEYDKF